MPEDENMVKWIAFPSQLIDRINLPKSPERYGGRKSEKYRQPKNYLSLKKWDGNWHVNLTGSR